MDNLPTEGVQVFTFLENIRGDEGERESGHAELRHKALVDSARHPPYRNLPLKRRTEPRGQLIEPPSRDIREVHTNEKVKEFGCLRELVERVKA